MNNQTPQTQTQARVRKVKKFTEIAPNSTKIKKPKTRTGGNSPVSDVPNLYVSQKVSPLRLETT